MKLSELSKKIKKNNNNFYASNYYTPTKYKLATEKRHEKVELTAEQKNALAAFESGENVFLSGEAGTGKSFVLNEFIRRGKKKNILVCAPTGIAAINIGGTTLHRVFDIPLGPLSPKQYNSKPSEAIIKADTIVIDEISMCRFDTFEFVIKTIRKAEEICQYNNTMEAINKGKAPKLLKPKQIIVVGDFFQLPPVIMPKHKEMLELHWGSEITNEGFAFQTDSWKELCFKNIILKDVVRQKGSNEFLTNLNLIRKGDKSGIDWFNENASKNPMRNSIYLCPTNRQADSINREKADELPGNAVTYRAKVIGEVQESDKVTHDELALKVDMQVMTLVNNHEEGYKNGSIGRIISLENDFVKVELNTGLQVDVRIYDWEIYGYEIRDDKLVKVVLGNYKQIPLKIAYAITIHKSQGQTYPSANISPNCFAAGQLYVALSRVQNIEGMYLERYIKKDALIISEAVKEFYLNLKESSEKYELIEMEDCDSEKYIEAENTSFYLNKNIKERPNVYTAPRANNLSKNKKTSRIKVGDVVAILDVEFNEEEQYIVSEGFSKDLQKISIDTPVIKGAQEVPIGGEFEVNVGGNVTRYKLIDIKEKN